MMAAAKLCYLNHLDPKTLDSVALIFQMQKQNLYATHKRSQRKTTELCDQLQQKDYLKEFYWVDDTS